MVGRLLQVSARQIARYEAGDSEAPLAYAAGLARLAKVSLDELAGLPRGPGFSPQTVDQLRAIAEVLEMQQALIRRILGNAGSDDPFPDGMAADALRVAEGISGMPGDAARVPTLQDADDALRDVDAAWEREARLQAGGSPRRRPVDRPRTDS